MTTRSVDPTATAGEGPALAPADLASVLADLRTQTPLVQCITNSVVTNWTANVLLAAGAAPAMVDNSHEAAEFAGVASALLVNLGTPTEDTVKAMSLATESARLAATPWVLDPVAVGPLSWRTETAKTLLRQRPSIIRGNASEVLALAGGAGGRGVDATDTSQDALETARMLAREHDTVVAVSGEVDVITDGERVARLANGHEWLTLVTGVGCALGALMAACAAVTDDRLAAAATATTLLTVAAEPAAETSAGPGSFAVALLDGLHTATTEDLAARVRLS
ncbi:hydroxyethylthiazole kinase [Knoellia remsis]|uniref:Hydroxyethylthiazole kinase n=1 Tax=Knoellia remsis TaxID=407159 RepID=A0A2T0V0K0_9MICO|nr:hydroxyethylthiazole kinase [Knoellia remsis]PRY63715.1 hydroxyethylthiazole kinase [Knoellia remsis]